MDEESKNVRLTSLVLLVLVFLTTTQILMLAYTDFFITIPLVVSVNVTLFLVGYLAAECKHLQRLEENRKILGITTKVLRDFVQYTEGLKSGDNITLHKDEISDLIQSSRGLITQDRGEDESS